MKRLFILILCLLVTVSLLARGPMLERNPKLADLLQTRFALLVEKGIVLPDFLQEIADPYDGPGGSF